MTRVPWHDVLVPADAADLDEADAASDLRAARASLLPAELARYRALCREVAEVLTDAATAARPDDAERDVAARLAADLVARGIDPLVTLVAGRSRLAHRHPLPTAAPLGDRAMLVVCGRRHGLIANATRWVRWGASATDVGCRAPHPRRRGGVPRRHLGWRDGRRGVRGGHRGLPSGRIRRRGSGAGTTRAARPATRAATRGARAAVTDPVQVDQAFAWNPTAPGAKVEDTVLVRADGIEVLTVDPRWPTTRLAGRDRPIELDRVGLG